jgi:hypothetical protein
MRKLSEALFEIEQESPLVRDGLEVVVVVKDNKEDETVCHRACVGKETLARNDAEGLTEKYLKTSLRAAFRKWRKKV